MLVRRLPLLVIRCPRFSIGSNGSGISSDIEGHFSRENVAMYLDMETSVVDGFDVGVAVGGGRFDDFGSTTNSKLVRYAFNDSFAIRSTASTGFRAPTPGQSNVQISPPHLKMVF